MDAKCAASLSALPAKAVCIQMLKRWVLNETICDDGSCGEFDSFEAVSTRARVRVYSCSILKGILAAELNFLFAMSTVGRREQQK